MDGAATRAWDAPPEDVPRAVRAYAARGEKRGLFGRRAPGASEAEAEAWGLEAFAAGYASTRGMVVEDREELRRRLAFPFPIALERVLYGPLAGGPAGRIVLAVDHAEVSDERFWNVAVVPAPAGEGAPAAAEPFSAERRGDWLFVRDRVTVAGRAAARLDRLAAEASRLAQEALSPS